MGMSAQQIETMVREALPDADIQLTDLAGDNEHYSIVVTSPSFQGKTRVAQHKMVYEALGGQMGGVLHALALQTSVPK